MAQISPTTGGRRKKSNYAVTKLDFGINDLSPASNRRRDGERNASYIENFRKQFDGSYIKRAGTKALFNIKDTIIDQFGFDAWDNYIGGGIFDDFVDGEEHQIAIFLIDGQPYIKDITDVSSPIIRIPLLIYEEIIRPPLFVGIIDKYDIGYSDAPISGGIRGGFSDTVNNKEVLQGFHNVFYDKIFTYMDKDTKKAYEETHPDIDLNLIRPKVINDFNKNMYYIERNYEWVEKINHLKLYTIEGKNYISINNRLFTINTNNTVLNNDEILYVPWLNGDNVINDNDNNYGLDVMYVDKYGTNFFKTQEHDSIKKNQHYILYEIPTNLIPPSIYGKGLRNYISENPNTATNFFINTSKIDYDNNKTYKTFHSIKKSTNKMTDASHTIEGLNDGEYADIISITIKPYSLLKTSEWSGPLLTMHPITLSYDNNHINGLQYIKMLVAYDDDRYINNVRYHNNSLNTLGKISAYIGEDGILKTRISGFRLNIRESILIQWWFNNLSDNNELYKDHDAPDIWKKNSFDFFNSFSARIIIKYNVEGKEYEYEFDGWDDYYNPTGDPLFDFVDIDVLDFFGDLDIKTKIENIFKERYKTGIRNMNIENVLTSGDLMYDLKIDIEDDKIIKDTSYTYVYINDINEDTNDMMATNVAVENIYYAHPFEITNNSLIVDFKNWGEGYNYIPIYSGSIYYAINNNEKDRYHFSQEIYGHTEEKYKSRSVRDSYFYNNTYKLVGKQLFNDGSGINNNIIYSLFDNLFSLSDEIDYAIILGELSQYRKTPSVTDTDWEDLGKLNKFNNQTIGRIAQGETLDNADSYNLIISIPSSYDFVIRREIGENPDPTKKASDSDESRPPIAGESIAHTPYQYNTVSWNVPKFKNLMSLISSSTLQSTLNTNKSIINNKLVSGNIVKVITIKQHLLVAKEHSIIIDNFNNYTFTYLITLPNVKVVDVFIHKGKLYVVTDDGKLITYTIEDKGDLEGISLHYDTEVDLKNQINGDIKAIKEVGDVIYIISTTGFYDIYSITFQGEDPTVKSRLLSEQLESNVIDDINNADTWNIIPFGDTVFFILGNTIDKFAIDDDQKITSKVYIRDKIQGKYFWSVYKGKPWNIKYILASKNINNNFTYLDNNFNIYEFGKEEKLFPNSKHSPTEKYYLDEYTIDSEGNVVGIPYIAFIKTNLINASEPTDIKINYIALKLNFMNNKSDISTGISYEKNGEMVRNNIVMKQVLNKDGRKVNRVDTSHTYLNKGNLTISKRTKKNKYIGIEDNNIKIKHRHTLKKHTDTLRDTDKEYEDTTNAVIKIKKSSFETSNYSIEIYHDENAPLQFYGFIIEELRRDRR